MVIDFPGPEVVFLPSVCAKGYIADDQAAIITSGNLTVVRPSRDHEYAVRVNDHMLVREIRARIGAYAAVGTNIELSRLQ